LSSTYSVSTRHLCLFSASSFFFKDTPSTEIYTLSLHDALPICEDGNDLVLEDASISRVHAKFMHDASGWSVVDLNSTNGVYVNRSEEHTSELQSQSNLVCRLLLEKKNRTNLGSSCH